MSTLRLRTGNHRPCASSFMAPLKSYKVRTTTENRPMIVKTLNKMRTLVLLIVVPMCGAAWDFPIQICASKSDASIHNRRFCGIMRVDTITMMEKRSYIVELTVLHMLKPLANLVEEIFPGFTCKNKNNNGLFEWKLEDYCFLVTDIKIEKTSTYVA